MNCRDLCRNLLKLLRYCKNIIVMNVQVIIYIYMVYMYDM